MDVTSPLKSVGLRRARETINHISSSKFYCLETLFCDSVLKNTNLYSFVICDYISVLTYCRHGAENWVLAYSTRDADD